MKSAANTTPRIGALLLAAGSSSRMGENKLLLSHRGKPLVCHAARTLAESLRLGIVHFVCAVCGRDAKKVAAAIATESISPAMCVFNSKYESGISSSLRCGLRAVRNKNADAVLIMLGDMPRVSVADIREVASVFAKTNADIVAPVFAGRRGNPVLFSARLFAEMMKLRGDVGARKLFSAHTVREAAAGAGVLFDIDSPADWNAKK